LNFQEKIGSFSAKASPHWVAKAIDSFAQLKPF